MSSKEDTIDRIYHDVITGYGSVRDVYKQAVEKNPSITYKDVKQYMDKLTSRQVKFTYKKYNTYVPSKFLEEMQCDLADFTKTAEENDGHRYAFCAIDVFSRYAWAIPIKSKKPSDIIYAFNEVLKIIGKPDHLFSDSEGSLQSTEFIKLLNKNNIKHTISLSPAPYVERFIGTLKSMIHDRLVGMKLDKDKWTTVLEPVLAKYNLTKHESTEMRPIDGKKDSNKLLIWWNLHSKAKKARRYPELKVGNEVRVMIKKTTFRKQTDNKWTSDKYKVIAIEDNDYLINDGKRRLYSRWELLKV